MERRLNLSPLQRWGVPLLTLFPLLAIIGPLAAGTTSAEAAAGGLEVEVSYPARVRRGLQETMTITLRNVGADAVQEAVVELDRAYADAFVPFSSQPRPASIDDSTVRIEVGDVPPGGSRSVVLELTPRRYWRVSGVLEVTVGDDEAPLRLSLATMVLP